MCLLCLQKKAILTTIGVLEEPLGNARLHGARLMAALLHTNTPSINQELCRLNTMDLLLVSWCRGELCLFVCSMQSAVEHADESIRAGTSASGQTDMPRRGANTVGLIMGLWWSTEQHGLSGNPGVCCGPHDFPSG